MPAGRIDQTIYIGPGANIESMNVATLYKPGELGKKIETTTNKDYQIVQVDSGATAATSVGVVASGQVAFWKDKANYIVTNNPLAALGAPGQGNVASTSGCLNEVAGVFRAAMTAAYFGVIQTRGKVTNVVTDGSNNTVIGDNVVVKNSVNTGVCVRTAAGTAPPNLSLGRCSVAEAASVVGVDLDLPQVP